MDYCMMFSYSSATAGVIIAICTLIIPFKKYLFYRGKCKPSVPSFWIAVVNKKINKLNKRKNLFCVHEIMSVDTVD